MRSCRRWGHSLNQTQLEMEELRSESMCNQTWGRWMMSFTSTNLPKFAGVTSWEQYRQVFDAIVLSNGWDDATAALQLLSHLEGDVLNVTLLVPETRRAARVGLIGALTGRLADYCRWFEKTTRKTGRTLPYLQSRWRHWW